MKVDEGGQLVGTIFGQIDVNGYGLAVEGGTIGELSTLLKSAAIYAVRTGVERIDASVLAALEWEPPSARHAPSLGHV